MHYERVLHYGGPGPAAMIGKWASLADRFTDHVQTAGPLLVPALGPCHQWTGSVTKAGYGKLGEGGQQFYAHRVAWWLTYGVWPGRLRQVCGNRRCVRIEHLQDLSAAGSAADR